MSEICQSNLSEVVFCEFPVPSHNLDAIYFFVYGILMTFLIFFGTFGNVVSIIVFCSPKLWACVNYYLIALALWDLALLLTSFSWWSLWTIYYQGATRLYGDHAYVLRYAYICGNVTITGCIWVMAVLTVERYVAILHPLKHRTLNNACRARFAIFGVSVAAALFNAGRPFEIEALTASCCDAAAQLIQVHFAQPTELRMNPVYHLFYRVLGSVFLLYLLPCSILAVLTVRMCMALRKATRVRTLMASGKEGMPKLRHKESANSSQHTSAAKSEANTNRMLTVVLIKFLFCYTLPTFNDILELATSEEFYYTSAVVEVVIICSNTLVVLNSSCNFLIYLVTGKRFRNELLHLLTTFSYSKRIRRSLLLSDRRSLTTQVSPSRQSCYSNKDQAPQDV